MRTLSLTETQSVSAAGFFPSRNDDGLLEVSPEFAVASATVFAVSLLTNPGYTLAAFMGGYLAIPVYEEAIDGFPHVKELFSKVKQ